MTLNPPPLLLQRTSLGSPMFSTARDCAQAAGAASTLRAYRTDRRAFADWCEARRRAALPAAVETVAPRGWSQAAVVDGPLV